MRRPNDRKIQAADIAKCRAAFRAFCQEKGLSTADDSSVVAFKKSRYNQWNFTLDELRTHVRDNSAD